MERAFDVVVYGASGFTGRQAARYLAASAPASLRWALAGRRRDALESVRAALGARGDGVGVIVADSADQRAIDAMAAASRTVVAFAGPFARYGTPVVDACVRHRTHYADITGEVAWVRALIDRYHEQAAADGTRVVPGCGFDSVPSDLGAMIVAREMLQRHGVPCRDIHAFFRLKGGLNGGTVATAFNTAGPRGAAGHQGAFALCPGLVPGPDVRRRSATVMRPGRDPHAHWYGGPFFMAGINGPVVRRSAVLLASWGEGYGPEFAYQEGVRISPPLATLKGWATLAGLAAFGALGSIGPGRALLQWFLPRPGEGPSEDVMEHGWFSCDLVGVSADGRAVRGRVAGSGDPGNRCTVRFACESAIALALEPESLPGAPRRGGVLTPATALGDVLVRRLRDRGVTLEIAT